MANSEIKAKLSLDMKITVELTLEEARALNEITRYNVEPFLKGFYSKMGKSYLEPHENGVRSLFKTLKENLPFKLYNADEIIKAVKSIKLNP